MRRHRELAKAQQRLVLNAPWRRTALFSCNYARWGRLGYSEEATVTDHQADNKSKNVDVCCIEDQGCDNALMPEQLEQIFAKIRENPVCLVDYADCPQVMSMLMERGVLSSSSESISTNMA